jgi:hypothetical protein
MRRATAKRDFNLTRSQQIENILHTKRPDPKAAKY